MVKMEREIDNINETKEGRKEERNWKRCNLKNVTMRNNTNENKEKKTKSIVKQKKKEKQKKKVRKM